MNTLEIIINFQFWSSIGLAFDIIGVAGIIYDAYVSIGKSKFIYYEKETNNYLERNKEGQIVRKKISGEQKRLLLWLWFILMGFFFQFLRSLL